MRLWKLAIIACAVNVSEAAGQQLTDPVDIAIARARSLCQTVKEARGQKTTSQLQADLEAKTGGLWKFFDVGGGVKGSINREAFEGLTREATANALKGDQECRQKMFDPIFKATKGALEQDQSAPQALPAVLTEQAAMCAINLIVWKTVHVGGLGEIVGPNPPTDEMTAYWRRYLINKYPTLPFSDRFSLANACWEVQNLPAWPPASSEEREYWQKVWRASLLRDLVLIESLDPKAGQVRAILLSPTFRPSPY